MDNGTFIAAVPVVKARKNCRLGETVTAREFDEAETLVTWVQCDRSELRHSWMLFSDTGHESTTDGVTAAGIGPKALRRYGEDG